MGNQHAVDKPSEDGPSSSSSPSTSCSLAEREQELCVLLQDLASSELGLESVSLPLLHVAVR